MEIPVEEPAYTSPPPLRETYGIVQMIPSHTYKATLFIVKRYRLFFNSAVYSHLRLAQALEIRKLILVSVVDHKNLIS